MSAARSSSRHMLSVDLTPMIDVVLQLIIFFMLTSRFGDLRRTEIDLPKQAGEQTQARREPGLIVDLTGDGRVFVDSRAVSLVELERLTRVGLDAAGETEPFDVLIRPDRNAPARQLDRVLSKLAAVGVRSWKLGTVEPGGNP
ncbi:MAG: biopolymer transporter ExbD [Planctomycetota bacterium]